MTVASNSDGDKIRRQWITNRLKISTVVRRSSKISDGAYRVWAELAFGWAWNEPTCFPTYAILSEALGVSRSTIYRAIAELEAHGLVEKSRLPKGNKYALAGTLPPKFSTEKVNNKELAARARKKNARRGVGASADAGDEFDTSCEASTVPDVPDVTHLPEDGEVSDVTPCEVSDVTPQGGVLSQNEALFRLSHVSDVTPKVDEVHLLTVHPDKREYEKEKHKPVPSSPASGSTLGMRDSSGNEGSTDPMAEAEDLIAEDEAPLTTKGLRRKSKKRAPSAALVSWDDQSRVAYPEALGSSQSNAGVRFDAPPPPPPVDRPDDVLSLLRGEVENKWGKKGARGFAMELTGELSGKITNTILRKYPPDVILSMVRLLVWDWEVARGVCFPPRKDVAYPDVTALVQYAKELAARIETGFDYMASRRGALNTYHDLFIRKLDFIPDDDPF